MDHDHELVETHLLQLVNGALEYFLQLTSEIHREAWTQVLLLLFVRILQLCSNHVRLSFFLQENWERDTIFLQFKVDMLY